MSSFCQSLAKPLLSGAFVFLALVCPAVAGQAYSNGRFGYAVSIPDMVSADRSDPQNGDGVGFHSDDGSAELRVWGGFLVDGSFAESARNIIDYERDDGWTITYMGGDKKRFVVYSGVKDGRIVYARSIPVCHGDASANFRLEYPEGDKAAYDAAIRELNKSLKATKGGCF